MARRKITREELIDEILSVVEEWGYLPRFSDFVSENGLHSYHTYIRVFGSFRTAVKEAGLDYRKYAASFDRDGRGKRQKLIEDLRQLGARLGRIPKREDMHSRNGVYSYSLYCMEFGNFTSALEEAGFSCEEERRAALQARKEEREKERQKETERLLAELEVAVSECIYTEEDLIKVIRDEARRVGRPPLSYHIARRHNGAELLAAINLHFGSLKQAISESGLEYDLSGLWNAS